MHILELRSGKRTTLNAVAERGLRVCDKEKLTLTDGYARYRVRSVWSRRDWVVAHTVLTVTSVRPYIKPLIAYADVTCETDSLVARVRILNPHVPRLTDLRTLLGAQLATFKPTVMLRKKGDSNDILIVESLRLLTQNALSAEPAGFVTDQIIKFARESSDRARRQTPVWSPAEYTPEWRELRQHPPITHSRANKKRITLTDLDEFYSTDTK